MMPIARFEMPDGRIARFEVPDGTTPEQAQAMIQAEIPQLGASNTTPAEPVKKEIPKADGLSWLKPELSYGDILGGAVKGASNIGATLLTPFDALANRFGIENSYIGRDDRKEQSTKALNSLGADTGSMSFKGGELGAEIAGTAGMGGLIAKGLSKIPGAASSVPKLINAVESGGFRLGTPSAATFSGKFGDMAMRAGGGAITGGASAGLVNLSDADTGAMLGGGMPVVAKAAGAAGKALAGKVSDEVASLYEKAKSLGIDIPLDRLTNSRPMNAMAASLNYVPLSGRAAAEKKMYSQFNRAVSRTFGQDSDNVTMALRKASTELGKQFDETLQKNTVKIDTQFLDEMAEVEKIVQSELNPMEAKVITNKIGEILDKGSSGQIDGQAAYNIKKALDRIGNRSTNDAYYARELKKKLMGALNRSMPSDEAKAFATLRKQYGNMLDIEGIALNGADRGVSVAKMANMKGINNPEMQDIADIAAQFLITREAPHGAAQRVTLGALGVGASGALPGAIPWLAGGMALGRGANAVLNSNTAKNALLNPQEFTVNPLLRSGLLSLQASP